MPKFKAATPVMRIASDSEINVIRGKALVGAASPEDTWTLLQHITALEHVLDEEADPEDMFGTEGWREHFKRVVR
jgi:hypothetical protein